MNTSPLKTTMLNQEHRNLNAKMVNFAGFDMPIQYKNITSEHLSVRENVGIFDVSHMGQFEVSGTGSFAYLQNLIPSDLSKLIHNDTGLYTQLLDNKAGIIDDLIIYKRDFGYLLVVNASNIEKNWAWLQLQLKDNLQIVNKTTERSLLALQGPKAEQLLLDLTNNQDLTSLKSFGIINLNIKGISVFAARSGYTGEDGFEIFVESSNVIGLWQVLLDYGQKYNLKPCGLGARDTLRIEAALPLYGHELTEATTPLEASLGWCVKFDKGNFIGRDRLVKQQESGLTQKLICLKTFNRIIPRQGYAVVNNDGQNVGIVTSGTMALSLGYPVAMAYVKLEFSNPDTQLQIMIRGSSELAQVVKRPFYKRSQKK